MRSMKQSLLLLTLLVTSSFFCQGYASIIRKGSSIQAQEVNDSTTKVQKLNEVVVTSSQSASKRMKEVQIGVEKIDIEKMTQIYSDASGCKSGE